jgi:CMP-N-acetylneuraminic acid synthetase
VPDKNIRILEGHPVIAYTIAAALQSDVFSAVMVSTDSEDYARIARYYGAETPFLRPREFSGELSPDIEWVEYTLKRLRDAGREYQFFSILRPTSPFRQPQTIERAWQQFHAQVGVDSLRAVEKCRQHPGKMWVLRGGRMFPLLPLTPTDQPWHSSQYQSLPEVYVQNASLEIAWTKVVFEQGTISGNVVIPFLTEGHEGFDINSFQDWWYAQYLLEQGEAALPRISKQPISMESMT